MLKDKVLDQFAILTRIVEEIVCVWEESMQESTDYTFRRNSELRISDAKKLIEVCYQYISNNEYGKVKSILQYYESVIENWDELVKEEYQLEMVAYQERLEERRKITIKQLKKKNKKPEISETAPNYHDEEKIHKIVYNKAVKNVLDTHSYLYKMIGYSLMNEGMRANLYAQGIETDRRCLKAKVSVIADGMDCAYEENLFRDMYMNPRADADHVIEWLEKFPEMKPPFYQMLEMYKTIVAKEQKMYEREWVFAKNMSECVLEFKELKMGICALYLLLGIVDENQYCGNDLLVFEALENERIWQPEQCYIFSMCRGLSMKYQDYTLVLNWLMSQQNQNIDRKYNPLKEDLSDFLMAVLLKEIYSPQVMEMSMHKLICNQTMKMKLSEIKLDEVEYIPTRLSKEGVGLYIETKKKGIKDGHNTFRGDKKFLEKLTECNASRFFAHTNEMVSGRHKWGEIFDIINELEQEKFLDSFIQLTGYNSCLALLYGLDGICIYKDKYKEYKDALRSLIKEIGRYIKVFGAGTEKIIYTIFKCIKEVNQEHQLWAFCKNNPQYGIECINLVATILKKCDVEMLVEYYRWFYLEQVFPTFHSKRDLFLKTGNSKELHNFENELEEMSKSLELEKRIKQLSSQMDWNEYLVNQEIWNEIVRELVEVKQVNNKEDVETKNNCRKPSNTKGRWYCFLQKIMIDALN